MAAAVLLVAAACTSGTSEPPEVARTTPAGDQPPSASADGAVDPPADLVWTPCGADLECATLPVPLDHSDPGGTTIDLALARRPAGDPDDRIGSLLVNPGGPGASGVEFLESGYEVSNEVSRRFDLVSWDPRGVGGSSPLSCGGTADQFLTADPSPDTDLEQTALEDAARTLAEECALTDGDLLPHLGTESVVRDLDRIRSALDEDRISYLGFSYGTLIGLLYADAFPERTRAIVLDGVVDPAHDHVGLALGQAEGLEATLQRIFEDCGRDPTCPVADAAAAYAAVADQVETAPLRGTGGEPVGPAAVVDAAVFATYDESFWPGFTQALADARDGDGAGLRALADEYHALGDFAPFAAVLCVDWPHPDDPDVFSALADRADVVAPTLGRALGHELLPCAFWAAEPTREPRTVSAAGAPPILVVGNTGDAATPFDQAVTIAGELASGTLLTFEGEGHTSSGKSACVDDAITRYLVDLELPVEGTVC